jgi:coatomer protein complex subunit alpha (xenin)
MNGWPVFEISEEKQAFMNIDSDAEEQQGGVGIDNLEDMKANKAGQDDDEEEEVQDTAGQKITAKAGGKWKDDLDIDFSEEEEEVAPTNGSSAGGAQQSVKGAFIVKENSILSSVRKSSNIASEFAAVGLFKEALEKLETQIGMKQQDVIAKRFADLYLSSELFYSTMSFVPTHSQFLVAQHNPSLPLVANNLKAAERKLKQGYNKTTEGEFVEAIEIFRDILTSIPLLSLGSKADLASAEKLISICLEYIVALSCDLEKKKTVGNFYEAKPRKAAMADHSDGFAKPAPIAQSSDFEISDGDGLQDQELYRCLFHRQKILEADRGQRWTGRG